jgi:hypothetical protein
LVLNVSRAASRDRRMPVARRPTCSSSSEAYDAEEEDDETVS